MDKKAPSPLPFGFERARDRLLTVAEAASLLGVKRSTLYQWAREGRLPSVKLLGRALRFRESDLQRLINKSVRPALRTAGDEGENLLDRA
jgi:excisionase family DNA binding protein